MTHYIEIDPLLLLHPGHSADVNLYILLQAKGAPVVYEENRAEKGVARWRSTKPIRRVMVEGAKDGMLLFAWDD